MAKPHPPVAATLDQRLTALGFFKDWTNYLLVTTVAALGWVSTQQATFSLAALQPWCMWFLAASIVFAILTLALIPLVAEQVQAGETSFHHIQVKSRPFWMKERTMRLKRLCWPQHVFFLIGIILYTVGNVL